MAIKRQPNREVRRSVRHPTTAKRDAANSVTYLLNNYPRTLFPLSTTQQDSAQRQNIPTQAKTA